ncbi:dihydrolipoyl dehydrogenase [Syntrophothermus lipocalidus]|uniref:Dihydrolipoyl dehydrogenase n=1 Tax=Syntrophothermus lipocalidus (strain DSM 12680 / TGB-C1) TaxID=643648 RepID=D7CJH1_SYNLT|nr:dihydrolipoyl dehydrogenase [Syntrophothermus lipocalidus]ADI02926.1 dihydrolipoamide dehydrogenase [Syntrophothermus lipocalidus DSM 12680]
MGEQVFDVVFIGGGPAGYQGAIRAAQLGMKVAVVESRELGGVCLNRGCIPTKAIRASVEVLSRARRAKAYGIEIETARPDIKAIIARKNKVVGLLRGGISQLFRSRSIEHLEGTGTLLSPREVEVETANGIIRLKAGKIVIATGSRPSIPSPFTGLTGENKGVLTTDDILEVSRVPASLLIVGAGAVGVEMASIMAELGSSVTLLEMKDRILPGEDLEMASYMTRMLKRQKVKVLTGLSVNEAAVGDKVTVMLSNGQKWEGDAVLMAAGRVPNVESIGLRAVGLAENGRPLAVNEHMETGISGIFAAGDVVGGWLLAHVAFAEGITAAENAAGLTSRMDYRVVPRCVFAFPEYAAVGLSEEEAKEQFPATAFSFPFKSLGMAQALGEWEGMVKLVVHEKNGQILGGHVIGPHAADLVAEIALAMRHQIPAKGIVDTIHTHPTLSEAVLETAQAACGQAIHMLPGEHTNK